MLVTLLPAAKLNIRTLSYKLLLTAAPTLVGLLWVLVLLSTSCNFGWTVPAAVCCTWGVYVAWTLHACKVRVSCDFQQAAQAWVVCAQRALP